MNQEPTWTIFGINIEKRAALGLATLAGLIVCSWIMGPLTVAVTWLIQRWAASEIWQARDRWSSVAGFAWVFGAIAVILFAGTYISIPVLTPTLASLWGHLPAGWDATARLTIIRWSIALPFAPLLAIPLEMLHPQTRWYPRRTLTEAERTQLLAEAEKKQAVAQARAQQAAKKAQATVASSQRPPSAQSTQSQQSISARDRLVTTLSAHPAPETLPEQQVRPSDVQQRMQATDPEQRTEQAQSQQQTTPAPQAPTIPPATEQQETPKAPPAPKKYNWDQGEGSLKDL